MAKKPVNFRLSDEKLHQLDIIVEIKGEGMIAKKPVNFHLSDETLHQLDITMEIAEKYENTI